MPSLADVIGFAYIGTLVTLSAVRVYMGRRDYLRAQEQGTA